MSKAVLIIELTDAAINAALFTHSKTEPETFLTEPFTSRDEISEKLSSVLDSVKVEAGTKGTEALKRVWFGIPVSEMSMRVLDIPFEEKKKIDEVLPFELNGLLSNDVTETVVESIPLGNDRVLAVAIDKSVLRGHLEMLKGLGVDPVWIGPAPFSMPSLLNELSETQTTAAFISDDFISVSKDAIPLFFNSFDSADTLKLNLKYLEDEGIAIEEVYTPGRSNGKLKALLPDATINDELDLPDAVPIKGAAVYALAHEIREGRKGGPVNFRKGEFEYTREKLEKRKKLRGTFALLAILFAILLGDLYIRYSAEARELETYRDSLQVSYLELFPGERKGAATTDTLYSLKAKYKRLAEESSVVGGEAKALGLLKALTTAAKKAPGMEIRLHEVVMRGTRVQARGVAASFDAANQYREALLKEFPVKDATVTESKSKSDAGVSFSLVINLI